ncbi:hypothetical protein LCGC14_0434850 [marine sediment metagenome]|uniref:Nuclease associated modular domain-containing protein n=1 Tax=marine sediment metagenome TaxID=412755 RepID=A0A0F9VWB4_9ZZZZ
MSSGIYNNKGKDNHFYGKKHTLETRLKMCKSHKSVVPKILPQEWKDKISKAMVGHIKRLIIIEGVRKGAINVC